DPVTLPGRAALSAPVFGWNGELRAALTLVGDKGAFDNRVRGRNASALRAAAERFSAALGHARIAAQGAATTGDLP
ncbi:MAG: IclR family transcriptional regulator, partial [Candidatus Parcubacteria bacterium]|nr:IclR family transcriptional regulator [Burkholderiales bacterium]